MIILLLIALAIPLAITLRQIAWEALASREAREVIAEDFPSDARISELDIDFHSRPIAIIGTVITPQYRGHAEADLQSKLVAIMRAPVVLSIDQIRTADGTGRVSSAAGPAASATDRIIARLTERLALVAGVPSENILIDASAKRAFVRATPIPGADVGVYRVLEARVADSAPGWTIILVPPATLIADIPVKDGVVDQTAVQPAIWAAQRLRLPLGVSARRHDDAAAVVDLLTKSGVEAKIVRGSVPAGAVELKWLAPEPPSAEPPSAKPPSAKAGAANPTDAG